MHWLKIGHKTSGQIRSVSFSCSELAMRLPVEISMPQFMIQYVFAKTFSKESG